MPKGDHEIPGTLKRSPKKAQRTWEKTLESAEETYGEDSDRAFRTAYASLKHSYEKVGDHWEPKDEKGRPTLPARPSAPVPRATARRTGAWTPWATRRRSCSSGRARSTCADGRG